jgi:hypothetical protein
VVIDLFSKIEPDYSVNRAMSLRLSFVAKRAGVAAALVAEPATINAVSKLGSNRKRDFR